MKRKIITYGGYFERFIAALSANIYRVFFIFDDGQIVVLFNGFQKKTQKTPSGEIEKALKIKEAYYADK
ncbi:type II toxin-antitoxin system RelE/ParE family toxin [uncultured Parabacteroides sp.]|uniref:type II toxin-antitoxin system RelE/ParE family toxin n=1 Tax=uncultured Parabacteroides sp. TaxID=512312 RepID=UPI0025D01CA2|nr:type II toxin-antitoxin system RelE/ParE family toxin [uncultured Parabacteroides sp.]